MKYDLYDRHLNGAKFIELRCSRCSIIFYLHRKREESENTEKAKRGKKTIIEKLMEIVQNEMD